MNFIKYILVILVLFISINNITGQFYEESSDSNDNYDECLNCIDLVTNQYDELVAILRSDIGVVDATCDQICIQLSNETWQTDCNTVCSGVGLKEFSYIIRFSDEFDMIYMCRKFNVCPFYPDSNIQLINSIVTPASGVPGTNFNITANYKVISTVGTSEIDAYIKPLSGGYYINYLASTIVTLIKEGLYQFTFQFQTTTNLSSYPIGQYLIQFIICENGCENNNSTILNFAQTYFNVTQ